MTFSKVENLLPDFYKKDAPNLIKFLDCYYEWLSQSDKISNLYDQFDIDSSLDEFIKHFINVYMNDIPEDILGNVRFLQKHIIELYRSKGSPRAYKLLFALLFNEDVDTYTNVERIFSLSSNDFDVPRYMEVFWGSAIDKIENSIVVGSISGAQALIEQYIHFDVNNKTRHVLYISNISGIFVPGDILLFGNYSPNECPSIIGSVVGLNVISSAPGFQEGDIISNIDGEVPTTATVKSVKDGLGVLTFKIDKPGSYYSIGDTFKVDEGHKEDYILPYIDINLNGTYPFPKKPDSSKDNVIIHSIYHFEPDNILPPLLSAPTGGNASIKIMAIINTHMYLHNEDILNNPVLPKKLNETFPFPKKPDSNINTVIADSLTYNSYEVGNISKIRINDPGVNYSHFVYFVPIDPITSKSGILDANGEYVGMNGRIIGTPIFGDNIIDEVLILDSGFDNGEEQYLLRGDDPDFYVLADSVYGGVGVSQGQYLNNRSFLSDDNYFFDNYFYQTYAYVILASRKMESYSEIVKKIIHPAGLNMFGDVSIQLTNNSNTTLEDLEYKVL